MPVDPAAHEHVYHLWNLIVTGITSAGGGIAVWRGLQAKFSVIIEAMPPLPPNASWRQQWFYASLHALATPAKASKVAASGSAA